MDFARLKVDAAIRCEGCGHSRVVKVADLAAALGWGTRIPVAQQRLKCNACGRRGARLTPVPRVD